MIEELRQELKEQIKENQELIAEIKELNVDNEWWNNRYKAQVRINEEHKKLNGELRKENDALITVIDLAKNYMKENSKISSTLVTEPEEETGLHSESKEDGRFYFCHFGTHNGCFSDCRQTQRS